MNNTNESFLQSLSTVCADCNFPQVNWISINKGVYLCDDCCSIHRSLGRHLSYVRSIQHQRWPHGLMKMCESMLQKNTNSIWEYELHYTKTPSQQQKFNTLRTQHLSTCYVQNKPRKPQPNDPQTPIKESYIKCKYQELAYTQRMNPGKDSPTVTVEDFSQQLHASARTNNLETCLRLLALGAQPSYLHPHRGSSPLHVSAQAGQVEQSELLFVYGADPCLLDKLGHTPEECARIAGHHDLADRLLEMQYECSDRLCFYLNELLPDHRAGEHFIIPDMFRSNEEELLRSPMQKLRNLNNFAFEDLCQDVFDEIDRRETERAWLLRSKGGGIPFLPNNCDLNHLRNQSRQKLGLLTEEEFRQFVSDILLDSKRRQDLSIDLGPNSQQGGTLVPLSDSYNPLIPQTNNEYDLVPEEFRRMLKESDSTNEDRDSSIETTLPDTSNSNQPVFPVVHSNEEYKHLENCYQQCLTQLSSVEGNVSDLQDIVSKLEAKLEQVSRRQHTISPPSTPLDDKMAKGNGTRGDKKNNPTVFNLTSRQSQPSLSLPNQRHTILGSPTPPMKPPNKPVRIASYPKPEACEEIDENILMPLIARLVEQISFLMESIRSSQHDQLVTRVNSIVFLSEDMQQLFPPDISSVYPFLRKLNNTTSLLKSLPLVATADEPLDTNKLISLVIEVSNAAKRLVAAISDKNVGRVVSSV